MILISSTVIFTNKVIEIRPDIPQLLFILISVCCFAKYYLDRRKLYLHLSSVSLLIAFLFLQKTVFLFFIVFLLQLIRLIRKKLQFREILIYWSIPVLVLAALSLYLALSGKFSSYLFYNWILNMKLTHTFLPLNYLIETWTTNPLLWIFFVYGLVTAGDQLKLELAVIGILNLVLLFLVKTPYQQYFLPAMPFLAIVTGKKMVEKIKDRTILILMLLAAVALPGFRLYSNLLRSTNRLQLKKIEFVLNSTSENDRIYDGNIQFNLFRKDLDYFWYSVNPQYGMLKTYREQGNYDYDIYDLINRYRPRIISNYYIDPRSDLLEVKYRRSTDFNDIYILVEQE